jgi:hypothetical protein
MFTLRFRFELIIPHGCANQKAGGPPPLPGSWTNIETPVNTPEARRLLQPTIVNFGSKSVERAGQGNGEDTAPGGPDPGPEYGSKNSST